MSIPRGVLTVVCGVAGSGKSSLVHGHLQSVEPSTVIVDQRLGRGSRRSNPATYTGMLDPIRIDRLVRLLDRLVDGGATVIVIEHDLDVIARADWIIDLGPGAGRDGGRVVFEGTPAQLVEHPTSLTGQHLALRISRG